MLAFFRHFGFISGNAPWSTVPQTFLPDLQRGRIQNEGQGFCSGSVLGFELSPSTVVWCISIILRGENHGVARVCVFGCVRMTKPRRVQVTCRVARYRWEFPHSVSDNHSGDTTPSCGFNLQPKPSACAFLTRVCVWMQKLQLNKCKEKLMKCFLLWNKQGY